MGGGPAHSAVDSLHTLTDGLGDDDEFSLFRFDTTLELPPKVNCETINDFGRQRLRDIIETCRTPRGGGTYMWSALTTVLSNYVHGDGDAWIVCLTDGASTDKPEAFVQHLAARPDVHLIIIGVGLPEANVPWYHGVCTKNGADPMGEYVQCGTTPQAIAEAFAEVRRRVSEVVEASGDRLNSNDAECRRLLEKVRSTLP